MSMGMSRRPAPSAERPRTDCLTRLLRPVCPAGRFPAPVVFAGVEAVGLSPARLSRRMGVADMADVCATCGFPPVPFGPRFKAGHCAPCHEQLGRYVAVGCTRGGPFCSRVFTPQSVDDTVCSYCRQVCPMCERFAADGLGDTGECLRCAVGRRSTAAVTGPGLFDDLFRKDNR